jgi:alanine racemase
MSTADKIRSKCAELEALLVRKNNAYGDSALSPANIFYKGESTDSICIRIDDKLNRIRNVGITDATEDTVMDLAGYLILLMISME